MAYRISTPLSDKQRTQIRGAVQRLADRKNSVATAEEALGKLVRTALNAGVSRVDLVREFGISQSAIERYKDAG